MFSILLGIAWHSGFAYIVDSLCYFTDSVGVIAPYSAEQFTISVFVYYRVYDLNHCLTLRSSVTVATNCRLVQKKVQG